MSNASAACPRAKSQRRVKNRQIHFRDALLPLVAAWQPVLVFQQRDWDVTACGSNKTWKAMFLDVALFPDFTPTSLFTSSRHVLKQCWFAPVRANHRRRWAEYGNVGSAATGAVRFREHGRMTSSPQTAKPSLSCPDRSQRVKDDESSRKGRS